MAEGVCSILASSVRIGIVATDSDSVVGFRRAAVVEKETEAVPEPITLGLAALGLLGLGFVALRKKFRRA